MTGPAMWAVLKFHGLVSGDSLLWVTGAVMLVTWALAMVAVWGSVWGSRHQLTTVAAEFLFFVVPVSTLLLPPLSKTGALSGGRLSLVVILLLLIGLLLSAWYHAQRCLMPSDKEQKVNWPPCKIDLAKQTLSVLVDSQASRFPTWSAAGVGAASVVVYHWLASMASGKQMVVIAAVIAFAMGLWLCLLPLGRALGQGWRLRQLENLRGVRVVSDRLPWLTKERQRFALGRWLSRW